MSIINDESNTTFSGVASGATSNPLSVNTSDNGEDLGIFVDNGSGGAPADHTIIVERHSPKEDRWMEYGRTTTTGATQQVSYVDPAIPDEMRIKIVNDSAASADFRVNLVSH